MDSLRRLLGEGVIGEYAGPRAFFKTVAGPGPYDAYPGAGENPSVYYARRLKNVTFPRAIGNQALEYDTTDHYDFVFNLEPLKYIEEGAIVLCFRENGQWYTIDKVLEERPCCGNRLFRGPGSLSPVTLSLESRQTWRAISTSCSPVLSPSPIVASLGGTDIALNYEWPIPSSVQSGATWVDPLGSLDTTKGWYVSDTVNLFQIPGDPVWTGTKTPVSGRYIFAVFNLSGGGLECVVGFLFDDEWQWPASASPPPANGTRAEWLWYMGQRDVAYKASVNTSGPLFNHAAASGTLSPLGKLAPLSDGTYRRAVFFWSITGERQNLYTTPPVRSCAPLIQERETLYDYDVPFTMVSSTPACGTLPSPGVYLSPMRQQQTFGASPWAEVNPLNTALSAGSATPPPAFSAISGTRIVFEQLSLWVTLSE